MQIRFVKLAEKWFIDIPWIGDVNDLQMVDGADSLLDILSEGNKEFNCTVSTSLLMNKRWLAHLEKISEDEIGADYQAYSDYISTPVWLCNVTKHLFEIFPDNFYIYE